MEPVPFKGFSNTVAKDSKIYMSLPVHTGCTDEGAIVLTSCWQLTWRERLQLLLTGRLWHQLMTFGNSAQPQMMYTTKPRLYERIEPSPDRPPYTVEVKEVS